MIVDWDFEHHPTTRAMDASLACLPAGRARPAGRLFFLAVSKASAPQQRPPMLLQVIDRLFKVENLGHSG